MAPPLKLPSLDIRLLSLKDLYMAKNINWCFARQELARKRPTDLGLQIYRDEDFDDLLELVGISLTVRIHSEEQNHMNIL